MTDIGVGVARAPGKDPKFISVQLFGRPKSLQYEFQISNTTGEPVGYSFGGETHQLKSSFAMTHSACSPGDITFDSFGTGFGSKRLTMRYQALDGLLYMLKPDAAQGLRIEIAPIERVR
jgi:hypothetical protein